MAPKIRIPVAICYDFDDTLAPGNMAEYGLIERLGTTPEAFWPQINTFAQRHEMDTILAYMLCMCTDSATAQAPLTREELRAYGRKIRLFPGVQTWFARINEYARQRGILLEHYIISSGLKEILEGTSIAQEFRAIFASAFLYNEQGLARWPAMSVNYTNKTQFLFRINKGCLDVGDNTLINQRIPQEEKHLPFSRMIYIGDGETDVPCMLTLKNEGGHSIAVYRKDVADSCQKVQRLLQDRRVDFVAKADYRAHGEIETYVQALLDKIAADAHLHILKQNMRLYQKKK